MGDTLLNVFCGGISLFLVASFVLFERLLQMESQAPAEQRHHGSRAASIFGVTSHMSRSYPEWSDVKALLLSLRLYVVWLFQTPLWARSDRRARRALWTMRSLFWAFTVGFYLVKETVECLK